MLRLLTICHNCETFVALTMQKHLVQNADLEFDKSTASKPSVKSISIQTYSG